ncbi:MAG: hypothetical protein Q4C75_05985 [Bergeyella zoohelcum]|nr:hypothetical protein [Bergeyella zoohelcum]
MKKLVVLSGILLGGFWATAQVKNNNKKQPVMKQSDTISTEDLKKFLTRNKMSVEELKAEAKKRGIPYRIEKKGSVSELQGFDKKGMPIYYTTYNQPNKMTEIPVTTPKIEKKSCKEKLTEH